MRQGGSGDQIACRILMAWCAFARCPLSTRQRISARDIAMPAKGRQRTPATSRSMATRAPAGKKSLGNPLSRRPPIDLLNCRRRRVFKP
jgi:hypothetical protein